MNRTSLMLKPRLVDGKPHPLRRGQWFGRVTPFGKRLATRNRRTAIEAAFDLAAGVT